MHISEMRSEQRVPHWDERPRHFLEGPSPLALARAFGVEAFTRGEDLSRAYHMVISRATHDVAIATGYLYPDVFGSEGMKTLLEDKLAAGVAIDIVFGS